jgi:hypothetical protein
MTDRELLEKAAKAAGIPLKADFSERFDYYMADPLMWNPLTDDGDALRLAVKLGIMVCRRMNINGQFAVAEAEGAMFCPEPWFPDPYAATRRAIVRAAAMDVEKPQV